MIALRLNSASKLEAVMGTTILATSETVLCMGTWYEVSVYFMYTNGRAAASISIGGVRVSLRTDTTPFTTLAFTESSSDVFKIGGFSGTMQNFQIHAPGSPILRTCKEFVLFVYNIV